MDILLFWLWRIADLILGRPQKIEDSTFRVDRVACLLYDRCHRKHRQF